MKLLSIAAPCALLLAFNGRRMTEAFIAPNSNRKGVSSFRVKATDVDISAAINKVMKSTPPPHIPAESVIQHTALLVSLWDKVAFPNESDEDTDFKLSDYGMERKDVKGFINHFQTCKDCSADHAFLMATQDDEGADVLRLSNVYFPILSEVDKDSDWGLFDEKLLGDEIDPNARTIFPEEPDDEIVLNDTKEWVQKVIADFGVCPFTIDKNRAGIPMGGVRYAVSRAVQLEIAFLRYWEEVQGLLAVSEKEMSTILLVFPELGLFGDYELFEAYCESLADALCATTMGMECEIQLVFFHPRYQFRDGQARTGDELGAANFARRSPWPMINILRTPQVKAAQKGVPTGQVYKQNEERLSAVGTSTLETMLYDRNWEGLPAHAAHSKGVRAQELQKGVPLSISTAEVISGRVSTEDEVVAVPAGVCPFPHGMTTSHPAPSHAEIAEEEIINDVFQMQVDVEEEVEFDVEVEDISSPLVDMMDRISEGDDNGDGGMDYIALAEEVERWLALEELQRNQ